MNRTPASTPIMPTRTHWSAEQLAAAVPPRLHAIDLFDASLHIVDAHASANAPRLDPPRRTRSYLPARRADAPFRIG